MGKFDSIETANFYFNYFSVYLCPLLIVILAYRMGPVQPNLNHSPLDLLAIILAESKFNPASLIILQANRIGPGKLVCN